MEQIVLQTFINAPAQRCFDLSRSIELHCISTSATGEKAMAGVTSGLIGLKQEVTWRARHFGIWMSLSVRVTAFTPYTMFADEMSRGLFKTMLHRHSFEVSGSGTLMTDVFRFSSPLGFIGRLVDKLILKAYLKKLLVKRNEIIRSYAEGEKWKVILKST